MAAPGILPIIQFTALHSISCTKDMQTTKLHHLQVSESTSDSESCVFTLEGALVKDEISVLEP